MIIAIYSNNIAVFVQVFVGSVGYSIYCEIPTNNDICMYHTHNIPLRFVRFLAVHMYIYIPSYVCSISSINLLFSSFFYP